MRRWLPIACLLCACGTSPAAEPGPERPQPAPDPEPESEPTPSVQLEDFRWPQTPASLPPDVTACVQEYRSLANEPFPDRPTGMSGRQWYEGPFQDFIIRYNAARERCDATFASLDESSPEAQIVLATQSVLHEHMAARAAPHDDDSTIFVMARYWTLGAACTYQHCAGGPLPAWAELCRRRGGRLPDCPGSEPQPPPTQEL